MGVGHANLLNEKIGSLRKRRGRRDIPLKLDWRIGLLLPLQLLPSLQGWCERRDLCLQGLP
jgi:hypothetical protein